MKFLWHDTAWSDYVALQNEDKKNLRKINNLLKDIDRNGYDCLQNEDKKTLRKINNLLKDIDRNGYDCTGKPEPLKGDKSGWWSLRIDEQNRLIFKIEAEFIEIYQCKSHYGDK